MKKIYLKAYCRNNLGDDLFLYVICKRYKNHFCLLSNRKLPKEFSTIKNLRVYNNYLYTIYKKIFKNGSLINFKEMFLKMKSDIFVYIGGSIFIEPNNFNKKSLFKEFSHPNIYILGSNFGPYHTNDFLLSHKELFKNIKDICFRERHSFDLFSNISSCRFESDILFSPNYSKYISDGKKICISVIDCNKKYPAFTDSYEKFLIDYIDKYSKLNYKIVIMSFCESEGDLNAAFRILSKIDDPSVLDNIHIFNYKNSIEDALYELGSSEIIIGSRFHSNIIGLCMGKKVLPVAYSDKTINALRDLDFKGNIFDIRSPENFKCIPIDNKQKVENLDSVIASSKRQFIELDKVLDLNI